MPRRKDLQLSRESIAETALSLFRHGGLEALSTRKVAAALGASPMSLYVHVGNKQGLLDAVVERLMSSIEIDLDARAPWTEQAAQWVYALRHKLSAHPDLMGLLQTRRWAIVRCSEPLVRALLGGGLSEEAAIRATRLLTWSTIGFLTVEAGVAPLGADENEPSSGQVERSLSRLRALEDDRSAPRAARASGVDRQDIDALFALQTRLLIEGLAALPNLGPAARPR